MAKPKRTPRKTRPRPKSGGGALVLVSDGAIESLDRARRGAGLPLSREFLLTGLCHLAAICFGSGKKTDLAFRTMLTKAFAEALLERMDDDDEEGDDARREPADQMTPGDVRRALHELLDAMAGHLSQLADYDPQEVIGEIHRIRIAIGPVLSKQEARLASRPGFDGRA